ncbi:hypothetical protein EMIT0180MI3_11732 [Priestia megaterium]|jgi:hypothetical protein|nr:hypothetical protein [Priestia megaterium]
MRLSTKEKFRLSILATLRWTMAITFLIYGMAKIYPGQFITGDSAYRNTREHYFSPHYCQHHRP